MINSLSPSHNDNAFPGVLVAGINSGCGKTTVTLGLLAALKNRGLKVQPFKCGPDFIDPTLHKLAAGVCSLNLDLWMCGSEFVRCCFQQHASTASIAVVEGVMGLYDGGEASSAELAKFLGLPVILVVDAKSAAESIAAVVKGFETMDPEVDFAGVILNRVGSQRHLELLQNAIAARCRTKVLGSLPRGEDFVIPERHLGLHMADDTPIDMAALGKLSDTVAAHIDLDRLLESALKGTQRRDKAAFQDKNKGRLAHAGNNGEPVRIAVARDRAFCFYYEDNFDLLRRAGAELVFFSPLFERELPAGIRGIYLGGGYPELYAGKLAANTAMLTAIRRWCEMGGPVYAECGGFMYLTQGIRDGAGCYHAMAGIFPVKAGMKKGRVSLGYRAPVLRKKTFLGEAGMTLRGHEFHYSQIDPMPDSVSRIYDLGDDHREGYAVNNVIASYIHLHFGITPSVAGNFAGFCREGSWLQGCKK